MGNRAVIQMKGSNAGFYVHWNGGRDSVLPFLDLMRNVGIKGRDCVDTPETLIAKLALMWKVIFDADLVVDNVARLDCDNYDNGVYLIDEDFNIVGRKFYSGPEQDWYSYDETIRGMNEDLPNRLRLTDKQIGKLIEAHKEGKK